MLVVENCQNSATFPRSILASTSPGGARTSSQHGGQLVKNSRPLRWSRRYAVLASALGALAGLAGPVRPAVAYTSSSGPTTTGATSRATHGETINVIIPSFDGDFIMTVSNTPIQLSDLVLSADRKTLQSTGQLGAVMVTDDRYQSQPGWSMSGHVSDFSGGGPAVSGAYLGWTPLVVVPNAKGDVDAGPAVIPGSGRGLSGASLLAAAPPPRGLGATVLGATLYLEVPASTPLRSQSATLTVTLVGRG